MLNKFKFFIMGFIFAALIASTTSSFGAANDKNEVSKMDTNTYAILKTQLNDIAKQTDSLYGYNLEKGLRKWRGALAALDTGAESVINLNFVGDSIFEGTNGETASIASRKRSIVSYVRDFFAAKYGSVGDGFIAARFPNTAAVGRWAYTGTWVTDSVTEVYGWSAINFARQIANAVGATATLKFKGTGIVVLFEAITNAGFNPSTVTVTVDGVLKETKQLYNATPGVLTSSVLGLDDGDHTLLLADTAGKVSLLGAYEVSANTTGVRVNRLAVAGAKAGDYTNQTVRMDTVINYWTPKLTIIDPLKNDSDIPVSLATYKANYQTLITAAKTHGDVLLCTVSGLFADGNNTIKNAEYIQVLYDLADENDIGLIDIAKRWGNSYVAAHDAGFLYDGHPNATGHKDAANVIYNIIGTAVVNNSYKKFITSSDMTNVYAFDLDFGRTFFATIDDSDAKTFTPTNVPEGCVSFTVWLKCLAAPGTITDGATWDSTPTFENGKLYKILYESFNKGYKWYASLLSTFALPAAVLITDSFDRANSTTSLGDTDTGQTWEVIAGTWGINNNKAYVATDSGAPNIAVVDSGISDCTIQMTYTTWQAGYVGVFRLTDASNFFALRHFASYYTLFRKDGGSEINMGSLGIAPQNGDVIKIVLNGDSISIYINDTLRKSATSSFNRTATKHGLSSDNSTAFFDDFSIRSL